MALLAACGGKPLTFEATPVFAHRFYADRWQDKPFDEGAISVLSEEHGDLHTYTLTPCHGGANVCGDSVGHLQVTPDYYVITNAYDGRTFYISPGGDGYVKINGVFTTIAWN